MVCRVRVDAPAGIIELEGEAAFVSSFFEKMLPLIEKAGFGVGVPATKLDPPTDASNGEEPAKANQEGTANKPKKKKRANPPAGASCRDRILTLKTDGFFKSQKTPSEIVAGLAKKGWVHNGNQVGASLTRMFEKSEIQRTSDGAGFSYYWDRD